MMTESVLKELFPYFDQDSTTLSRENMQMLCNGDSVVHNEVMEIVLQELKECQSVDRVSLLKSILFKSRDETIKKSVIQELARLKSQELSLILSGYLRKNRNNTPSKIEAIRQLGKASIRRYLERK
jgi:hypothetical protein